MVLGARLSNQGNCEKKYKPTLIYTQRREFYEEEMFSKRKKEHFF